MQTIQKHVDQNIATLEAIGASTLEVVRCPNCGSLAERYSSATQQKLQCDHCDYLMTTCAQTGRVIEAYAPGLSVAASVLQMIG